MWHLAIPRAEDPNLTDIGVWNIFANPDFPKPQSAIRDMVRAGVSQNVAMQISGHRTVSVSGVTTSLTRTICGTR